jgi:hypothetical protein
MFAGLVSPSAGIPGRIRIADIDANGYPDIIATFKLAGQSQVSHTFVLLNKSPVEQPTQLIQLTRLSQAQ